ncbi:E3 ubiquitin-protein ligase ubr1 [Coemansia pectinata]|uniref:E3 ubiquitin-protein ligase n=1 Tax=Coemansia pectinata TaxID=1052879 RepID=A0A9W8GXN4_9FUNG|nr:E3 ubiquitin-protein ligase ubr1 [Coemansia pectinata]
MDSAPSEAGATGHAGGYRAGARTDINSAPPPMTPEIEEALGRAAAGSQPSESFIDQPYSIELQEYLNRAPKEYDYMLTPTARKDILQRVSWYLLSKDNRLADLVPLDERTGGAPREELQDEFEVPIEYTEVRRGQPCGHVFKRGEGVYRCKNCSMDDTCVLCTRCFQATDHSGHDTSFSVNSGTGGCCDCGDPEAWKIPLRCRHHSSLDELEEAGLDPIISSAGAPFVSGYNNNECPSSVRRSIELTIAVVLEFILETFATSPVNLNPQFDESSIMEDARNASFAIGDDEPQTKFAVVLWNDEVHSFQDVIDQCTEALQCSMVEAKRIAETVDASGRDVLRVSTSIPELIDIATTMTNVSLSISIRAARDVFREQLSASLLIWLRDLACCKFRPLARVFHGKINNEIRAEISHQLCLRWVAPYRSGYLADILERQYNFALPESEYGDDDDAMDVDEYDEPEDNDYEGTSSAAHDTSETSVHGDGAHQSSFGGSQHAHASVPHMPSAEGTGNVASALPDAVDDNAHGGRGRRRRRSDSDDMLRQQGEERASPRGFNAPAATLGGGQSVEGSPPSLWLAETSARNNNASIVPTIHAAMGAAADAVDAARSSLARIMRPSAASGFPQHSMVPGGFPHSVMTHADYASEAPSHGHMQELLEQQDPDMTCDFSTRQWIQRVLRGCGQQRLDWFLIFDLQLWKEVRSGLRELYMATLMLDSRYKMKIALTFARNYPRLSRAFLIQDRAPEHSVLLFSVQLFTAPTLSASLVDHHRFMYIILDVLKSFFVQPTPMFLQRHGVILCDTDSFRNRRYFHVFHDMRYLAGTPQVRNWVSSKHNFLATYVGFIGLFQGMNPNRRAVLQHVEFEADTWVNAFNVTLQVAKSCRQFAECYGISARDLFFAMRGTLRKLHHTVLLMAEENCSFIIRNAQDNNYLPQNIGNTMNSGPDISDSVQIGFTTHLLSTLWGKFYEVVQYDVSSNPVSFHHPLHWFMAELCQHVKHLTDDRARDFGFASIRDMVFSAFDTSLDSALEGATSGLGGSGGQAGPLYAMSATDIPHAQRELLRILDYPIRVCVVMAQIRAGLWVRNGYVIRMQSHHYREVSLRENTYDQDIVMIQFFLSIWPDTDHILMTLLDRFGLYDWFSGRPLGSRVYEPFHLQYMVEEFLNLLIVVVSERHIATGKNPLDLARREIVHGCLSPISYSELSKKIPERLAEHTEFDNLLQQMADYRAPVSVMDFGLYELKDDYLDEVDPYFIHYSRNQREEVEELLKERLKKRMRKNGGDVDEVPAFIPSKLEHIRFGPFQRVGMVLHTPLACQVLFYALLHATHTANDQLSETMVDEALQLIVLALEDGRRGAVAREIGGLDLADPGNGQPCDRGGLWRYALEQGYPSGRGAPMNLLGLVLTLGLKPEMKQWKPKLDYIYKLFREGGPRIVSCIDDYYAHLEATPMGSRVLKSAMEETKAAERKKQAARARQAAILAEFASRQQNFLSQFGEEFDDLSDDDNANASNAAAASAAALDKGKGKDADMARVHRPLWSTPSGSCIVCQEECDGAKSYGVLSLVQASRAVRTAPLADAAHVIDILRLPGGLDSTILDSSAVPPQSPDETSTMSSAKSSGLSRTSDHLGTANKVAAGAYGAPSGLKGFPVLYHERGMAASTCGHLMHVRCFMQYCQGVEAKRQQQPTRNHPENLHRKEYLCPLCKSLGNVLLPALPHVVDYDPLVAADRCPERFSYPAAEQPTASAALFEDWLKGEWKAFGEVLSLVSGNQGPPATATAPTTTLDSMGHGNKAPATDGGLTSSTGVDGPSSSYTTASSARPQSTMSAEESVASGLAAMLRNPGSFPFNFADGLTDSIPRLDDLLRNAPRLPGGFSLQTLLSRFLPHLAGGALGAAPGPERLILPLSRYVRWTADRHYAEHGYYQGNHSRRHLQDRLDAAGNESSRCSSPDSSNPAAGHTHQAPTAPRTPDRMTSEQEAKLREHMEAFQFMYTRLFDVLQSVQRDNHVGLPAANLFEHLTKGKERVSPSVLVAQSTSPVLKSERPSGHGLEEEEAGEDDDEDDEDDDDDDYEFKAMAAAPTRSGGFMPEQPLGSLPPLLQNIVDHLRMFGSTGAMPGAGIQSLANNGGGGGGMPAQLPKVLNQPYPFDRAVGALFAHTVEVLELAQRGVRNPPVFDHEDSRTLPSGTLSDAIPEAHAVFMHSLGKIAELQYRTVFRPATEIARANVDSSDPQVASVAPSQRLRQLVSESQAVLSASSLAHPLSTATMQTDILARTRLEMLKDISYTLAPLSGQRIIRPLESVAEQSRWTTGSEGMPSKPFLMQDTFAAFTDISLSLVMPFGVDVWHLVRLFFTAELVRACVAVGDSLLGEYTGAPKALRVAQAPPADINKAPPSAASVAVLPSTTTTAAIATATESDQAEGQVPQPWVDAPEARDVKLLSVLSNGSDATLLDSSAPGIHALVIWATRQMQGPEEDNTTLERLRTAVHPVTVTKLVATLILPFLRRVALVFYLQYGVDIAREAPWLHAERQTVLSLDDNPQVLPQTDSECARLLKLLNLPDLHHILDIESQPTMRVAAEGWLRELRAFRRRHTSAMSLGAGYTMAVPISMPTLYSLVDLPDRFEVLFERSAKAFCPRCNGIPSDPALCLLCGGFVCAQSFCCEEDGIGECNMHMKTCGGTVGVYLLVKKCGLLLLHHDNGCFMSAPYLDQHGEVDLGLKRGRPLFLNKNRYEEMRKLVLTQKIPVFVARKIDQAFDIGGWVSL